MILGKYSLKSVYLVSVKYRLHILVPISVLAFLMLFSLYLDRKQFESGILVCENPLGQRPVPFARNLQFAEAEDRFEQSLAESTAVDDMVASALISPTRNGYESSLDNLSALSQRNPQNQLAAVELLSACSKASDHTACNDEVVNRAIALDGDNGAMWSVVASLRYGQADSYGAMLALERAVEASGYNDYFQRGLELVLSVLPETTDDLTILLSGQVINHAIMLMINNYSSMRPLVEMCSNNVIENRRLASACIAHGSRMKVQASSLLGSGMGQALQSSTIQGLGDVAESQRQEEEAQRSQQELYNSDTRLALGLMDQDARLIRYYFEQVLLSGETAAIVSLADEAKRLSGQWNYDPCPSVLFGNLFFVIKDFSGWALAQARSRVSGD